MLAAVTLSLSSGPLLTPPAQVTGRGEGPVLVGGSHPDPVAMVQPGNGPSGGIPPVSRDQAVSADGRWVAFASDADDLVAGDTNETRDLFLRDIAVGQTTRIPWLDGDQLPSELKAAQPAITAHGEVVAFTVRRTGALTGATDPDMRFPLIAVYDRESETTTLLGDGERRFAIGAQPSISGDGRYLAYAAGRAADVRVVLVDRDTGAASVISDDAAATADQPAVSDDGRFIAFTAPAMAAGPATAGSSGVYRFDRTSGRLIRISAAPGGNQPDAASFSPSISTDGGTVAFASTATNLVDAAGLDGTSQVYVWEQSTGEIRIVSTDRSGSAGRGSSLAPSISGNGRFVAFQSAAPDLQVVDVPAASAAGTPNPQPPARSTTAVFVRDTVSGRLVRASVDSEGNESTGESGRPAISGDGMVVAYDSTSAALVPGDTNEARDVFIRVWSPKASVGPDPLDFGSVVVGGHSGTGVVAVSGAGWAPFEVLSVALIGSDTAEFALSKDGCSTVRLHYRDSCLIEITFSPAGLGPRSATVVIEDTAPGSPRSVRIIGTGGSASTATPTVPAPSSGTPFPGTPGPGGGVPGGPPSLILDPPIGPPGFVTTAIGTGFPRGARVSLRWDEVVGDPERSAVVGSDGTFRVGVLLFAKSSPGRRVLVASSAGGASFTDTTAEFLVVTGTAQPPASGAVRFILPEVHPIITRP